jgi:hypothetical protein
MRALARAALCVAVFAASGCVVEGKLDGAGGGVLTVRYRLVSVANFETSKARMQSADVRLTDATMAADKTATFALAMADVRKLSTAPTFGAMTVALADEADGTRTLAVTIAGTAAAALPAPYVRYLGNDLRIGVELPGEIVRSNATAVAGRKASWVTPLGGTHEAPIIYTVTFRPDGPSARP